MAANGSAELPGCMVSINGVDHVVPPGPEGLVLGRKWWAEHEQDPRCSKEQLRICQGSVSSMLRVETIGKNASWMAPPGCPESDATSLSTGRKATILPGTRMWCIKEKGTDRLTMPLTIVAPPAASSTAASSTAASSATASLAAAFGAPCAASTADAPVEKRKRSIFDIQREEMERIKRNREAGSGGGSEPSGGGEPFAAAAAGGGSIDVGGGDSGGLQPATAAPRLALPPAAAPAVATAEEARAAVAEALAEAPTAAPASVSARSRAPPPPSASVLDIDSDDEDEAAPAARAAAAAPPASAPVVISLDSDDDDAPPSIASHGPPRAAQASSSSASVSRAGPPPASEAPRRPVSSPGVWKVRRNGRFEPYPPGVQATLEAAYASGAPSALIQIAPTGAQPGPSAAAAAAAAAATSDPPGGGGDLIGYKVAFDADPSHARAPHRQVQLADDSKWRPVCRSAEGSEAAEAAAPASVRAADGLGGGASGAAASAGTSASARAAVLAGAAVAAGTAAVAAAAAGTAAAEAPPQVTAAAAQQAQQLAEIRRQRANAYEASAAAEVKAVAKAAAEPLAWPNEPLRLLSYNLWFDPQHAECRMREIARLAHEGIDGGGGGGGAKSADGAKAKAAAGGAKAAVGVALRPAAIAVQELTPSLKAALEPRLVSEGGYRPLFHQPWDTCGFNGHEPYGVGLTTRPPLGPLLTKRYHPYRGSNMGRGLVIGTAEWLLDAAASASATPVAAQQGSPPQIVLGSTHLESFVGVEHPVHAERRAQLVEAGRILADELKRTPRGVCAMLMGDMNWKDDEDGDALQALGPGWRDALLDAGSPKGHVATCYSWRFDRCFYLCPTGSLAPPLHATDVVLAGKKPGPYLEGKEIQKNNGSTAKCFPSDHKGPLFTFTTAEADARAAAASNRQSKANPFEMAKQRA